MRESSAGDGILRSYWFVPAVIAAACLVAAVGAVALDGVLSRGVRSPLPGVLRFEADGARAVLAVIATVTATVAGTVYSVVIVALSLAAQQYSPRVLRRFLGERVEQVVLGTFIGTFAYCVAVIVSTRAGDARGFVPGLAVLGAVLLALASITLLIVFIHHVAQIIQVSWLVAALTEDTLRAVDLCFPSARVGGEDRPPSPVEVPTAAPGTIRAPNHGYLERVDGLALVRTAARWDLAIWVEHQPGSFVEAGSPVVSIWPAERVTPRLRRQIGRAVRVRRHRSVETDPDYGVRQITDIAVKALSPGINDPTTARLCVDHICVVLCHVASRDPPPGALRDGDGTARVFVRRREFEDIMDTALGDIGEYGAPYREFTLYVLGALGRLGGEVADPDRRERVWDHVRRVAARAATRSETPSERGEIWCAMAAAAARLPRRGGSGRGGAPGEGGGRRLPPITPAR